MSGHTISMCTAVHGKACASQAVTLCTQPERCPSQMLSSLPPPQRGNVENDAIGTGSEPMEPEDGLQGSSQKEPLSHGSPPVPVAGPLNPTGAGSPGPDGTGKMIAGKTAIGVGAGHPLTMTGMIATTAILTVRRMKQRTLT